LNINWTTICEIFNPSRDEILSFALLAKQLWNKISFVTAPKFKFLVCLWWDSLIFLLLGWEGESVCGHSLHFLSFSPKKRLNGKSAQYKPITSRHISKQLFQKLLEIDRSANHLKKTNNKLRHQQTTCKNPHNKLTHQQSAFKAKQTICKNPHNKLTHQQSAF